MITCLVAGRTRTRIIDCVSTWSAENLESSSDPSSKTVKAPGCTRGLGDGDDLPGRIPGEFGGGQEVREASRHRRQTDGEDGESGGASGTQAPARSSSAAARNDTERHGPTF